jgi:hypothetical protein
MMNDECKTEKTTAYRVLNGDILVPSNTRS